MNQVPTRTSTTALERDVPVIRLKNDADLREMYEFGRKLGQGSFGAVYEATHIETQTKWAIKEVCRPAAGSTMVEMVDNEINILKQVNHAHIIHLEAIYSTAVMIYLVTECCKGGDLKQLLQQKTFFTEDETRHVISCLADAVVYLHKRDIVHRDLKLENILVKNSLDEDDGRIDIKVADFGLSVKPGGVGIENMMTEACGTLIYMAPEMMSGRGYSHWCDVWSIGVIMFMLLCGEPPFVSKTKENLLEKILNKEVRFTQPIWASVSDAAKYLLTCLLKADPAYRMSAHQLLENPWITGDNSVPSGLTTVLEMMHHYLENEERTQAQEISPLTSSEDMLEPSLASLVLSTETDSNRGSNTKLRAEEDNGFCLTAAPPKLVLYVCLVRFNTTSSLSPKESRGIPRQVHLVNGSDTAGPSSTSQSHAGKKPSAELSAKKRRCQDKKDLGTGQKPASNSSKADDQRLFSSCKVGLASINQQLAPRPKPIQNKTKK
ncbi:serine/threonine-protein kinase 33 [Leuresthes tenuis]|uniref:serine/threonine-protein kinase 33 n=1 Tax=Leuresthes tenuis TaxID=355514 RepID=UPI003B512465